MTANTPPAEAQPSIAPTPIQPGERIQTLDILRGFALFGILLVNMALFYASIYHQFNAEPWPNMFDQAAQFGIRLFAEGKFYTIFSFLFGLGFAVQMLRARDRGAPIAPTYMRRLLALLLIGIAHAVLIWFGDILVTYALLGFVLLLFRNCKPRTLLIWAGILLILPIIAISGLAGLFALAMAVPESAALMQQGVAETNAQYAALAAEATRVYAQGSYGEILALRLQELSMVYSYSIFMAPSVMIMFLLGLYAGKRGIFHNPAEHLPFIRKVALWGLIIGLPLNVLMALNYEALRSTALSPAIIIATMSMMIGAPLLCFAYIGGLTLLLKREVWQRRLAPLAAAGRMALTNYLLQSIICTTIFYSYGLGLYGQIGPAVGLLLSVAIFALQLPFSMWWLSRFQYGPAEWLWRTLTYLRPQPMIKQRAAQLKQEASTG